MSVQKGVKEVCQRFTVKIEWKMGGEQRNETKHKNSHLCKLLMGGFSVPRKAPRTNTHTLHTHTHTHTHNIHTHSTHSTHTHTHTHTQDGQNYFTNQRLSLIALPEKIEVPSDTYKQNQRVSNSGSKPKSLQVHWVVDGKVLMKSHLFI